MALDAAISEWLSLLGPQGVLTGSAVEAAYGADTGGLKRDIPVAVRPAHAEQVQAIVRIAARHGTPLHPLSTGRNWGYGTSMPARDGCSLLDLSGLRRIVDFDPVLGTVTVEPGVTQADLAAFLAAGNHAFLVPVTGAGPHCSLVGNALERGYGVTPYADHFSAVTDIEAVLADGTPYRSTLRELAGPGVARLFKWGVGPYVEGLFTQSGLAIVTQMTIALAPRPERSVACLFSLPDDARLEEAVLRIQQLLAQLGAVVGGLNLMNRHRVLAMAAPYPRESLRGGPLIPADVIASLGRSHQIAPWTGFATLYGSRRLVAAARAEFRQALRGVAVRMLFVTPQRARQLAHWTARLPGRWGHGIARTASTLAQALDLVDGRPNETALPLAYWRGAAATSTPRDPARDGCGLLWYSPLVPMKPAEIRGYTALVHEVTQHHGIEPLITLTSIGHRVFDSTVPLLFDRQTPGAAENAHACWRELFARGREAGFAPYRYGSADLAWLNTHLRGSDAIHQRLREALDPDRLISPGRFDGCRTS